ncbi:MAG TPA: hypothetical protein VFK70_16475 [Vicinamibacteria bacterium]|nr:hypothetical protein [Vicinamibacteria bacterium]
MRFELEQIKDRAAARLFKARIVELQESSRWNALPADVRHSLDAFVEGARDWIVKAHGTATWEEPETIEETKAWLGALPAASDPSVFDGPPEHPSARVTDVELEAIEREAREWMTRGFPLFASIASRLVGEIRRLRNERRL